MDDKNKINENNEQDAFDSITSIINENNEEAETDAEPDILSENISEEMPDQKEQTEKVSGSKIPEFLQPYMYYIKIAGVLVIVSGFIALMLAIVNAVTFDIIEETAAKEKEASVLEIFTNADSVEPFTFESEKSDNSKISVKNVYEVKKNSKTIGYCVNVSTIGFGGEIDMMVGTDINNQLVGIKIISMSETPGLGTKTSDENFTGQFKGISGTLTVGENIDAVSGATISSKAVTAGVNAVLSLYLGQTADTEHADTSSPEIPESPEDTDSIDASVPPTDTTDTTSALETLPPETQPPETETQPPETEPDVPAVTAPVETQPPETQPPETKPPETQPPETQPPETIAPETQPPETQPPETVPPETQPPETEPPVTETVLEEDEVIENEWRLW